MTRFHGWLLLTGLCVGILLVVILGGALAASGSPPPAAAARETVVLGAGGYWRAHATWREGITTEGVVFGGYPKMKTAPPPQGWMNPDFDDSAWFRSPGPFPGEALMHNTYMTTEMRLMSGALELRGRFAVEDPAAVKKLTLSMTYRGGVAVYMNGTEIARGHLPKGELKPETAGEVYSLEAYLDSKGAMIPEGEYRIGRLYTDPADKTAAQKRIAIRERQLGPVEVPLKLLRKGVNVLAVANHSSDYQPPALKWAKDDRCPIGWYHLGVHTLFLAAEGSGARPNVARPENVQVWNQDIHRFFTVAEYGDPNEKLGPIRLVGPRNGQYSGQVVVGSTAVIEGLRAAAGDLKGPGTIPASRIRVRYGTPSELWGQGQFPGQSGAVYRYGKTPPAYIALDEEPPARAEPVALPTSPKLRAELGLPPTIAPAALAPVWITVSVPKDAAAGTYAGTLAVSAKGIPEVRVPVELEVIDWTLPDPGRFHSFIGIYQSPETMALYYKVPRWSEEHWKLIEKSWQLLGELGNNLMVADLLARTQFGNEESLVAWIRQPDGRYTYDYTVFDRYLELARKYCMLRKISLQVLYTVSDWGLVNADDPRHVTGLDPATGKREPLRLPAYATDGARKAFSPMLEGVRERLKKHGLDKTLVLGIVSDQGIRPELLKWFEEVFPGVGWHYGAHNRPRYSFLTYAEWLYVPHLLPSPEEKRRFLWWEPKPPGTIFALSQRISDNQQGPMVIRTLPERAMLLGDQGPGRMCLDFWPVEGLGKDRPSVFNRWPHSTCSQREPCLQRLALPGRHGALSTVKVEALREGKQEAEARAFLEEALFIKKNLTGELAERCRKLLDARFNLCRTTHSNYSPGCVAYDEGWQKNSENLYRLAAEAAGKMGDK